MLRIGLALIAICSATTMVVACSGAVPGGGNGDTEGQSITLRFGHVAGEDAPYEQALQGFASDVEAETDGAVVVQTFPGGQLGGELDMVEQVETGALEGVVTSTGVVSAYVPDLAALELPYLFENGDQAHAALDGELGANLNQQLEREGFVNLGFWEFGFKNITNSQKPVKSADGMNGLTMRVLENEVLVDTYRALGADPTPIPFPETYTALQQGVADGFEGPYINFVDANLYEVQKYLSEVAINYGAVAFMVNAKTFDSLSDENQRILRRLGEKWTQRQREINAETAGEYKQVVEDNGVQILEADDLDLESFRQATESVYDKHPEFAEIVELARSSVN
ncbi:TRAP transporter substrate-binding protein [Qaidamihabitans albus]|uniref:TRAP transporter substrate-binding protein n=1 Tax=Qaidamihabitans albus TaxID=2795733 RepID=UPI0018F25A2D|nr:TRAP transporter substrate-binding protein [Qaidamihabitans albus]